MADRDLVVWTLGSFHAAGVTLGVVVPSYATGGLGDVLPAVGTAVGVAGYLYLWALSVLATRWALADDARDLVEAGAGGQRTILVRGGVAGGLVGLGALLGPLLVSLPVVLDGTNPASLLLVVAIGAGVAVALGLVVGVTFAVLDLAALRAARRIASRDRSGATGTTQVRPGRP